MTSMNRSRDESSSSSVSVASSGGGGKPKRNKNNFNSKRPNPNTVETVKMIMEQEGRSARNLVSWSIPVDSYATSKGKDRKSKRASNQEKRARSCGPVLRQNVLLRQEENHSTSGERAPKKSGNPSRQSGSGVRKPVNIRARYWAYLFENLRRAVDEIYITCEGDSSVVECKEVLLMLDNYHHDFQALIDWINLQARLENTNVHERPTSLAWEVRKSSPGRPRQKMIPRRITPVGHFGNIQSCNKISRCLSFSTSSDVPSLVKSSSALISHAGSHATGTAEKSESKVQASVNQAIPPKTTNVTTWADKVKGIKTAPAESMEVQSAPSTARLTVPAPQAPVDGMTNKQDDINNQADDEGEWETVTSRNRQPKHQKTLKSMSEPKLSSFSTAKVQYNETSYSETKISSLSCDGDKSKLATSPSGRNYKNLVADRVISSGGMTSPVGQNHSKSSCTVAVEFSQNCFEKSNGKQVKNTNTDDSKIEFEGDTLTNDAVLRDLDQAEAEYFDKAHQSNKTTFKTKDDVPMCNGYAKEEEKFCHLDVLEEEAASLARTLHAEHDASIAVAEEQERDLRRQIQEVEDAKEQETPETDTDCESARSSAGAREIRALDKPPTGPLEWSEFVATFEVKQHDGLTWGDLVEEEELREPGRAVQIHEKLSSPSRKRTPAESKRKLEEKHRSAEARRLQMHQEKTQKIRELTEKVQVVVNWKNDLIQRRRDLRQSCHTTKLARAEEQRAMQLLNIKKKAQAEDTKVNEIAFINELQEQNKRHEVLMRIGEHESRIQDLEQERTKMQEIKLFKEESVKERRRALEKERQERIEELKVKRKEQDARIEQQKMEKEKEREKLAKDRARERELRLSALNAAQQEAVSELQKKIQLKHDESERRHQEQLEQRKEKAVELSLGRFSLSSSVNLPANSLATSLTTPTGSDMSRNGPISTPTDVARVSLKGDVIMGDVNANEITDENFNVTGYAEGKGDGAQSHSSGSIISPRSNAGHPEEVSKEEQMKMQERLRTMKKRVKKLRTRMTTRGKEFLKRLENKKETQPTSNKSKIIRFIKDATRQLTNQSDSSGPWPANRVAALDRTLGEMNRILERKVSSDQLSFRLGGGFAMLEQIFLILLRENAGPTGGQNEGSPLPDKTISNAAATFRLACSGCHDNCIYALYSNRLMFVTDLLLLQISRNESNTSKPQLSTRSSTTTSQKKNACCSDCDVASPVLLNAMSSMLCELRENPLTESATSSKSDHASLSQIITWSCSNDVRRALEGYLNRGLDVISYTVASGILDVLSRYLSSIRHEVEPGTNLAAFVQNGLAFLEAMVSFVSTRNRLLPESHFTQGSGINGKKKGSERDRSSSQGCWDSDATQLLPTLQYTELMGIVSVLYGLLLHGAPERPTTLRSISSKENAGQVTPSEPKQIPEHTLSVAQAVMSVLNSVAEMDLQLLQASLGAEGVSLEFRHICTYLLWYCVQSDHTDLLHEVIICVGHFTLGNQHNQDLVDSGAQPTVLQQLCLLPFAYFSSPSLAHILFPSLIACCYGNDANLEVFEQEASRSLLTDYMQTLLQKSNKEDEADASTKKEKSADQALPRSIARSSLFTVEFLRETLQYFNKERVHDEVITDV